MENDAMPLAYPDQSAADFTDLAKRDAGFLQRLQLGQPLSDFVTNGNGKPGDFMFGADKNLGQNFDALLVCRKDAADQVIPCYRAHALCLQDKEVEAESFDANSPTFQKIVAEAKKKLKIEGRATMYGVDLLFWVPKVEDFAVFYFAKTARRQADEFYKLGGKGKVINFKSKKITTAYTWWVPEAEESKTPLAELAQWTPETLRSAHELFFSPLLPDAQPTQDSANPSDRPR
jgi:hypothetical protein